MLRLRFRFRDPGDPFTALTLRHRGSVILSWCNQRHDILEIRAKDEAALVQILDEVRASITSVIRVVERPLRIARSTLVVRCPDPDGETNARIVDRFGGLMRQPIVYEDGWEHYQALLFDADRVTALLETVGRRGELVVESKRRLTDSMGEVLQLVSTADLLSGLTLLQADALLAAVENGYYDHPRGITLQELAARRRVPRATFEEHVRKAESKLIKALAPHVALERLQSRPAADRPSDSVKRA